MKDPKTSIIGILTLLVTLGTATIAVLKGGMASIDWPGTIQTVTGVLVGLGLLKAADGK